MSGDETGPSPAGGVFCYGPDREGESGAILLSRTEDGGIVLDFQGGFMARCDAVQVRHVVVVLRQAAAGELKCCRVPCVDAEVGDKAGVMVCSHDAPEGRYWVDYTSVNDGIFTVDLSKEELARFADAVIAVIGADGNDGPRDKHPAVT